MKPAYEYHLSAISNSPTHGYDRATPAKPGKEVYNVTGFTGQPLKANSLARLLGEFEKLTGVELSHSRVYREVVADGISSSVVPAWFALRNHLTRPATAAVVLISRIEVPPVRQG